MAERHRFSAAFIGNACYVTPRGGFCQGTLIRGVSEANFGLGALVLVFRRESNPMVKGTFEL